MPQILDYHPLKFQIAGTFSFAVVRARVRPIFTPIDGVKMGIGVGKNGSPPNLFSLYQKSL